MEPLALLVAAFAGWLIVSRAPAILHTPLISSCMFLHAVVVVAGLQILLNANGAAEQAAGFCAVLLGAANAATGYAVSAGSLGKFRVEATREPAGTPAVLAPRHDRRRSSAPRRKVNTKRPAKD